MTRSKEREREKSKIKSQEPKKEYKKIQTLKVKATPDFSFLFFVLLFCDLRFGSCDFVIYPLPLFLRMAVKIKINSLASWRK